MSAQRVRTIDGFDLATEVSHCGGDDVIIWMHGISVDKDEYLGFFRQGASHFAERGFSSIRFDFRGHGESSGSPLDFTIAGQNLDARAIVEFAQERYGPAARLHVVGLSFGAPPAIFAAHRYPALVRSVSLIAPVLSYERTFLKPETSWATGIFSSEGWKQLDVTGRLYLDDAFYVGHNMIEEMRLVDPTATLRKVTQDVLVVHGDADSMVPFDASAEACKSVPQVRMIPLKGADHGFTAVDDENGESPESRANMEAIFRLIGEQCGA